MAINNKTLELFEEITEVNDIREMGELEIAGVIAYMYVLAKEYEINNFGESFLTFGDVNDGSYYCNKRIQLNNNEGYVVDYKDDKELIIDHVFMREKSFDTLWGFAYWYDPETEEESDMFLIRI